MAPSATETVAEIVTLPSRLVEQKPILRVQGGGIGAYKELAPTNFQKEIELKGTEGHEKAKVCNDMPCDLISHCPQDGTNSTKYPHYLPTWDPEEKYAPLQPFEHRDHGLDADLSFPDLLPQGTQVTDLTPTIGTEVEGIQLSSLTAAGKDQLARFVAQRRVVAFRKQDFADLPIKEALDFGGYFGRHHIHPTSGAPGGYPEIHLVHRGAGDKSVEAFFESRTSSVAWHSDVSYEAQPPGTTFLYIFDKPETGGDTIFVDQVEAYKRLSPGFQERLHGLKVLHSGIEQVQASKARGSIVRREPVTNEHPLVRTHPVTGEKALYVNPQCKF
jgi:sulfonate dioxygenase